YKNLTSNNMASLKVLIVDDEPGIRMGILRILRNFTVSYPFMEEDFDFISIEAETGEKAIEIIDSEEVDIILLDNKLPGIEGIEVLDYIKKKNYNALIMMITSYASLELAIKATQKGAYNFVPKPFTPEELRAAMENITKKLYLQRMTQNLHKEGKQIRFQFLSVLSHELKSPINAIEGYLNIMKDKQAGDNIDDYQVMINRSIERIKGMRSLIFDMLDFTRIESGKKKRNLSKTDICEIAKMAIDTMEPMAIQKNIKIIKNFDEEVILNGDANEIEIIFNNLISNAIKYNIENGKVDISIFTKDNNVVIIVEDTGIGMSEVDTKTLFNDFVRIKNEKTKNITGSGLGLSITKKIIDLYDGKIKTKSKEGSGTKFTITIPRK
ncbi:MAG: response regulator, partial [Bacteroidales bacterium]|nr:response regulator [Bacteroidales bacterium]